MYTNDSKAKEKRRKYFKEWRSRGTNSSKYRKQEREWREGHVDQERRKRRRYHLMTTYGMPLEDFDKMFKDQGGLCAICHLPETGLRRGKIKSLDVDHDHETDAIRGLLCSACNSALGLLREDPDRIESMLRYIRSWQTIPK